MAGPLLITSAVIGGVGAGVSGLSQVRSAQFNEQIAEQNRQTALQQTALETDRAERAARQQQGTRRARFGASGTQFTGSVLDILSDQAIENELDIAIIRAQGLSRARDFGLQAQLSRQRKVGAAVATPLNIASALIDPLTRLPAK